MEVHQNHSPSIEGYELTGLLGSGGSAHVYKARQLSTGQTVALKLLSNRDEASLARFAREQSLCAQLQHPHIIRIIDSGQTDNDTPYSAFEYIPGETLAARLLKEGPLPIKTATELMLQVLDALSCLHRQAIIHRDLNPGNIMLISTGASSSIKLLDFGISALLPAAQNQHYTPITLTTTTLGTPAYSAPEQLRGDTPTEASDIYAWALMFIECLTGSSPIRRDSTAEVIQQQLSPLDIALPASLTTHPLGPLLRQALRKNPQRRTTDAARLWQEINNLQLYPLSSPAQSSAATEQACNAALVTQVIPETYQTRHELTALCLSLTLQSAPGLELHPETLNALQEEMLNRAADIAARHQGAIAGCLASSLLLTFGYPDTSSDSIRRAIAAARTMTRALTEHDEPLTHEVTVQLHIGLDSGIAVTGYDGSPYGAPINNALRLAQLARADAILLGEGLINSLGSKAGHYKTGPVLSLGEAPSNRAHYLAPETSLSAPPGESLEFRGRTTELAQLIQLWQSQPAKGAHCALVTGEAGVGKSRLLREFEHSFNQQPPITLHCNCYPEQRNQALYPILRLLTQQLNLSSQTLSDTQKQRVQQWCNRNSNEPEALLVIVCQWLSLPLPEHLPLLQYSPMKQKSLLINALVRWLQQPRQQRETLLVIEDLHWSDPTTVALLNQLADTASPKRLLILISSRTSEQQTLPTHTRILPLQPLGTEHVSNMIAQQLPWLNDNPALLNEIIERSAGLPFFIEELIGLFKANADRSTGSPLPHSLRQSLREHLNSLGDALNTAQAASCIGREFSAEQLSRITRLPSTTLEAELGQLIAADIIQHDNHTRHYRFRHAMLQDAASQSMTQRALAETHLLIAEDLEADPAHAHQHQRLAYHFACAEQYEQAVRYGTEAAQHALGQALNEDASALANAAMGWAAHLSGTARTRAELQLNEVLTHIRILSAGWADAQVKAHADHSRALVTRLGQDHCVYPSLWSLALYHHVAGDRDTTAQLADQLVTLTANDPEPTRHCHATGLRGQCAFIDGQFPQAHQLLQQALELYDTAPQHAQLSLSSIDTKVWSLSQLANIRWLSGWHHQAVATSAEALSWARRLGHVPSFGIALLYRAMLCQFAGDKSATAQVSSALLALSTQYDLPAYQGYATVLNAWASNDLQQLQEMLSGLRFMGCQLGLSQYDSLTADIFMHSDQPQHAVHSLEQCLEFARQNGENYYQAELHLRLGKILAGMGTDETRRSHYHHQQAARLRTQQNLQPGLTPQAYTTVPRLTLPAGQLTLNT